MKNVLSLSYLFRYDAVKHQISPGTLTDVLNLSERDVKLQLRCEDLCL